MPSGLENKCCQSYKVIRDIIADEELNLQDNCITTHPGFASNCLDIWVLQASMHEYLQQEGPIGNEEPIHEVYRYLAYRRFVYLVWRRLGRKNRRVLPSCVVTKIRERFPSEQYCGFKYPD